MDIRNSLVFFITLIQWIYCAHYPEPGPDIAGQRFCEVRPMEQCCPGRNDFCTMPILDTVCYCDIFCNRTVSDCCPDFWGHCMGLDKPPPGAMTPPPITMPNNCRHLGKLHQPGDKITVNCNNCTCANAMISHEYNWKCTQKICLIRPELMSHVNGGNFGWTGSNYSAFWGMTLNEGVKYRLGTFRPVQPVKQMWSLRVHKSKGLPGEFDARKEWPDYIHPIQDQGDCGASWAFSTTSVASDRLAILSNGRLRDLLSAQHLLSCNKNHRQKGCEGGHLDRAWWYMRLRGVVNAHCYPYTSSKTSAAGECLLPRYYSPTIRVRCPSKQFGKSKVFQATPPYRIGPNERDIMKEILVNGPVQATMEVKEDFFMYKSGVYRYSLPGESLPPNHRRTGFHSVKIIGWGVDHSEGKPLKYWLIANSWGPKWGEEGHFRILRGTDECKIESFVLGMWPKVNGRQLYRRIDTDFSGSGTLQDEELRPVAPRHHRRRNSHWKW